jgi:lipopolysaccharide assembly protein A
MTASRNDGTMPAEAEQPAVGQGPVASAPPPVPTQATVPIRPHRVRRTRVGGMWVGLGVAAIVLLLLLIFILENGQRVDIGYFGQHGHLPLGVALLLAAVAGALLVLIPGTGRIIQLRRTARRHRTQETRTLAAAQQVVAAAPDPAPPAQPGSPG